eukprot:COSAG01_NODE_3241_length_6367_cov_5.297064_2_plen_46_part_00
MTAPVMLCCCINRGDVSIAAQCNKTFFTAGEKATAKMHVINSSKS